MALVKVEVLNAVVDGHGKGATIEVDEQSALQLQSIGYVKITQEAPKASGEKATSAAKKPAAKKRTTETKK